MTRLRELVCKSLCAYHKPGKVEEPGCGGLVRLLGSGITQKAIEAGLKGPPGGDSLRGISPDDPRLVDVCAGCDYFVDGCDFRDPDVPDGDCSPCGGLKAVALILAGPQKP